MKVKYIKIYNICVNAWLDKWTHNYNKKDKRSKISIVHRCTIKTRLHGIKKINKGIENTKC